MSRTSRRNVLGGSLAGAGGLAIAAQLADHYGLLPPDSGGLYGVGHSLTHLSHRLLASDSSAREFSRDQISPSPFSTGGPPKNGGV